ncbi:minor tail protein [Arthrobacter phage Wollypog]|uniref:Minor tail protein n=1 Tax=Arthrobacter phage Wollypog TaxID=2790985 RepID=A0A7T3N3G1_9CAUD|nr:minor tail protein [Arthrobacter phage Wollypog]QPX62638.1 minor tail protein [Arthrobacter phage Wollypog]
MRRNEIDKLSQAVRNLAGNPSFASTGGNQTTRTNLITNPRTEYTTGLLNSVVRTNLAIDPRGVSASNSQYGTGSTTLTGNVAISGHPEGITTALRVSYTTGSNPGIMIYGGTVAGQTYTMSAWIYHESVMSTAGSQGFAQSGILSMSNPPAVVTEVWQKITWQHTPSGTNPYGFRVSGQSGTGNGSYLITGILFEQTKNTDPAFFDGATPAQVNLVPNPSFGSGISSWTAVSASLTRVTNQGGDGHCGELSQTTAGGVRNSAVALMAAPVSAGTYTFAFDMKGTDASFTDVRIFCYDSVAIAVRAVATTPLIKDGNFNRYTFTVTADGVWDRAYMEVQGVNIPIGTKCWIDRAQVERAATAVPYYYEGVGELAPSWSGTPNASTSRLLGPNMEGWAQATTSGIYRTNTQSSPVPGGTYVAAVRTQGFNGDGIYFNDVPVVPGTSYTASAWIKITETIPTMSSVMRFKDSAGTILQDLGGTIHTSLVIGQWVRVSTTAIAPANGVKLQQMWRLYSSSYNPTTFYITGAMVEANPVMGSYFDGTTASASDYTYAWSSTPDRSTPIQRATTIPQIIASKSSSVLDAKFFGFQATAEDGKKTLKYLSPAGSASSSWRVAMISGSSTTGWDSSKLKAGGTYTFFMRYRSSGWGAGQTFYMLIADGTNLNQVMGNSPSQPLNATGWQEFRRTFTAVRDATSASNIYIPLPVLPQATTDGVFEIREWMLVEGEYSGDFIDGSKPFSKWDGAANLSSSIGYPPQLLDLAGKPILDYAAPGTYLLDDSFGTTEARSFYTVFETLAEIPSGGPVSPIIQYGDTALNDVVPNTYIQLRQDSNSSTPNSTNNIFLRRFGAQGVGFPGTVSRHVAAWGLNTSGYLFMGVDGNVRATDTQIMSMPHQKLVVVTPQTAGTHIRTIAYRGLHDAATALAISRYLGNKYGAAVA